MVWGSAKFSPSGKGNLSVPTSSMFQVACRHFAGRVHLGDEFATSQTCPECFSQLVGARVAAPEGVALRHLKSVDEDGTPRTLAWKIRHGFVHCAGHKRLLRRPSVAKATTTLRLRARKSWRLDGHAGEGEAQKKAKKEARREAGEEARYPRGLRFCQECKKLMDRDLVGCDGIGVIWLCARTHAPLPAAYDRKRRPKPKKPKGG